MADLTASFPLSPQGSTGPVNTVQVLAQELGRHPRAAALGAGPELQQVVRGQRARAARLRRSDVVDRAPVDLEDNPVSGLPFHRPLASLNRLYVEFALAREEQVLGVGAPRHRIHWVRHLCNCRPQHAAPAPYLGFRCVFQKKHRLIAMLVWQTERHLNIEKLKCSNLVVKRCSNETMK